MVRSTKGLVIVRIPEQNEIAAMRLNMIDDCRRAELSLAVTFDA